MLLTLEKGYVRRIIQARCAQCGKTELLEHKLGYTVDRSVEQAGWRWWNEMGWECPSCATITLVETKEEAP